MSETERLSRPGALRPDQAALFLDLDGTLAAIAPRPQDVHPDMQRNQIIRDLRDRMGGRLAVISGRPLADIDRILDGAAYAAAGVHGLERRRADGVLLSARPSPTLPRVRAALNRMAEHWPGMLIEDKGLSVAAHFRGAPQAAHQVAQTAAALAADEGLTLQLGDMVAELRTPGPNKGEALKAFMSEQPFGGAKPVFVGDDLTDEVAFIAARELGGYGVLVGPGRPTSASYRLAEVPAVLDWLRAATNGSAAA